MEDATSKKWQVRRLYIYRRMSIKDAAKLLGVNDRTARFWREQARKVGDDWDYTRDLAARGIDSLGEQAFEDLTQLRDLLSKELTTSELPLKERVEIINMIASAYEKMGRALSKMTPVLDKLSLANHILMEMKKFIVQGYPQHTEAFTEILEPFAQHLAKTLG